MSVLTSTYNCMSGHPDGLAKHIHVTMNKRFTETEVIELYKIGCIPLYIKLPNQCILAVVLGSDLVLDSLDASGGGNGVTEQQPVPTIQKVADALKSPGLSYYLDQIYTYLKIERASIELMVIGSF